MNNQYVNIRELLRNYKKFIKMKKTLIIMNHGKPESILMPYHESADKEVSLTEALEKFNFKGSGHKDLSQRIDEIVYGASNPHRKNDNT